MDGHSSFITLGWGRSRDCMLQIWRSSSQGELVVNLDAVVRKDMTALALVVGKTHQAKHMHWTSY